MTTYKNYFPILTLDSDYRSIIKPTNDYFVELDYNAAELRVLLGLSGKEQPAEDLHTWNLNNVYSGVGTRDEAKKRIFSWLYNPQSKDFASSRAYDREGILRKYWNGQVVITPMDRVIPAGKHHALNYLIQSTTSDIVLSRAFKIAEKLKDKKSFISFTLHDSIIIDFDDGERELVEELLSIFSQTPLGKFQVNLSAGKSYGDMRRIEWTQ
jgi:DNA polymerase I-like protein with 3'-5' exonuclease and polymerase domains